MPCPPSAGFPRESLLRKVVVLWGASSGRDALGFTSSWARVAWARGKMRAELKELKVCGQARPRQGGCACLNCLAKQGLPPPAAAPPNHTEMGKVLKCSHGFLASCSSPSWVLWGLPASSLHPPPHPHLHPFTVVLPALSCSAPGARLLALTLPFVSRISGSTRKALTPTPW